jgi:hypothetical protein
MTRNKIVFRIFGSKRLIVAVRGSLYSRRQQDSSRLGLWATSGRYLSLGHESPSFANFPPN